MNRIIAAPFPIAKATGSADRAALLTARPSRVERLIYASPLASFYRRILDDRSYLAGLAELRLDRDRRKRARLKREQRCRAKLADLVQEAGRDPLLMLDLVYPLIGEANWAASDGRYCSEREYVEELIGLARLQIETIAGWQEGGWWNVLDVLYAELDRREFEQQVSEDIWSLPEAT